LPANNDGHGTRAVVLGGSIAGLFAARVLSDAYDEVLIVDRDVLLGVEGPRRGCPQGRHINGLLARGQLTMEELFPGITGEIVADGVPTGDLAGDVRWFFNGKHLKQQHAELLCLAATRPLLEKHIRARTEVIPNISFAERHEVLGLRTVAGGTQVTGVRVRRLDSDKDEVLRADLVVDAMGRGSRMPVWLEELGYGRVDEESRKVGLGYVTQHYRLAKDAHFGDVSINPVASAAAPRGAIFVRTDGNRIEMTTYGILGDHPPTDTAGLREWMKTMAVPDIYDALEGATALDEPVAFKFPTTIRRRYEHLSRLPDGLIATGDAVCCFNPVYAQGMTVAALGALTLRSHLHTGAAPQPRRYFEDLASDVLDAPWEMTKTVDLGFPGVAGKRTLKLRMGQAFLKRVQLAATRDGTVTAAYMRAAGLVDGPAAMMRPGFVLRVLWKSWFGGLPAPTRASLAHADASSVAHHAPDAVAG
jgi:2-polyprenyl-6-methoxyphenol hydroxylase-like FAD-dependent oxidoreductase